jgi:hypothetical protein
MKGRTPLSVERLWDRYVVTGSGCWEYTGVIVPNGYGRFRLNGRNVYAHRAAYEIANGQIPVGMYVCHHCDNKPCINPDHLFIGSPRDNFQDAYVKGRITSRWGEHRGIDPERQPRGERHGCARLTEAQAQEILDRATAGEPQRQLAAEFGVSFQLVSLIALRKRWAHLVPRLAPAA